MRLQTVQETMNVWERACMATTDLPNEWEEPHGRYSFRCDKVDHDCVMGEIFKMRKLVAAESGFNWFYECIARFKVLAPGDTTYLPSFAKRAVRRHLANKVVQTTQLGIRQQ